MSEYPYKAVVEAVEKRGVPASMATMAVDIASQAVDNALDSINKTLRLIPDAETRSLAACFVGTMLKDSMEEKSDLMGTLCMLIALRRCAEENHSEGD